MNYEYSTLTEYSHTHSYPKYLKKFDTVYLQATKVKEHFSQEIFFNLEQAAWYFAAFTLSVGQKKFKLALKYLKLSYFNIQTVLQQLSKDNPCGIHVLELQVLLIKIKNDYIRFLRNRSKN